MTLTASLTGRSLKIDGGIHANSIGVFHGVEFNNRLTLWASKGVVYGDDGDLIATVTIDNTEYNRRILTEISYMTPDTITLNTGTSSDTVSNLSTMCDSSIYTIGEVAGTPGFDLECTFTGVRTIEGVIVREQYSGSATHEVNIQLYNYNSSAYISFDCIRYGYGYQLHNIKVPDDANYVSSNTAKLKVYHTSGGNSSHVQYIDYIALMGYAV